MKFNFNDIAHQYDLYYDTPLGKKVDETEKKVIKSFLEQMKCQHVLEIGCGTGHWTSFFTTNGFEVTGIDVSDEMLKIAEMKEITGATFLKADAHQLPFDDNSFNCIISIAAMEFMNDQPVVWEEIERVLKPQGYFLIGALNQHSQLGKTKDQDPVFRNADFFTVDRLKQELERFGKPEIQGCVLLNEDGEIRDPEESLLTKEQLKKEGSFLVGFVKNLNKKKI